MAIIVALKDGLKDARIGRSPISGPFSRAPGSAEHACARASGATIRIIALGLFMDAAYQFVALRKFYLGEAVIVSLLLAYVPYRLVRGPTARVASSWMRRTQPRARA
jgi:hypothetical protein